MKCSVIYGDIFARHDLRIHKESSSRLRNVLSGVPSGLTWRSPVQASIRDLERVHRPEHVRWIRQLAHGTYYLDSNTYLTSHSFDVSCYAAGSAIAAVERTLQGEHCFALVRPPGHHAEPDRAMGFCIFNNAAVAAARALESVDRVAILDWDLHHGNGTQSAFYDSDRVLYCSVHESNSFPGTGWIDEIGSREGRGYTLNAPLHPGATIADYLLVFEEVFVPAIRRFEPDVLIISAGQDSLSDDPTGSMNLSPADFQVLAGIMVDATDLPLALILEGGYGPSHGQAISHIFSALQGGRISPEAPPARRSTLEIVAFLKNVCFY